MVRATSKRKYLILVSLVILLVALLPTGCNPEGRELAMSFLREWAAEKNIDPGTPGGMFNIGIRAMGGSTGDEGADAVIDAGMVIKNLVDADNLMDAGRESSDISLMDQAINMRPDDWTYRVSKSNLLLKQGDLDVWSEESNKTWEIVEKDNNKKTKLRFYNQTIDEVEQVRKSRDWTGYITIDKRKLYINNLPISNVININ